jgi:hypothetical protein
VPLLAFCSLLILLSGVVRGQITNISSGGSSFTGGTITSPILAANGSAGAPSYSFSADSTEGIWRSGGGSIDFALGGVNTYELQGNNFFLLNNAAQLIFGSANDARIARGGTDGALRIFGGTTPTISSGFGTSPGITASGSNSLFQVNVGTGGAATSGVVAFHGTWTNAPYCFAQDQTSQAITTTAVANTTTVTLTATAAWTASSLINVFCSSI